MTQGCSLSWYSGFMALWMISVFMIGLKSQTMGKPICCRSSNSAKWLWKEALSCVLFFCDFCFLRLLVVVFCRSNPNQNVNCVCMCLCVLVVMNVKEFSRLLTFSLLRVTPVVALSDPDCEIIWQRQRGCGVGGNLRTRRKKIQTRC